jgi:hypothetical protein
MLTLDARHRPDLDQFLKTLGQHGAGDARDAPANVVEAAAAAQKLAHHEKGPAPADGFMSAGHGTELTVICHVEALSWGQGAEKSGFRT